MMMNLTCPSNNSVTVLKIFNLSLDLGPGTVRYLASFRNQPGDYDLITTESILEASDLTRHSNHELAEIASRTLLKASKTYGERVSIEIVKVKIELTEESVQIEDEMVDVIRSHALSKLSPVEVRLLELEKFATYDKLKNHNVDQ